jgi:tRNA A58 N-methylase Trm61
MLIIDRFEGRFAVVEYESGKVFNLPRYLLPTEAKEGDVINLDISIDHEETAKRKLKTQSLMDELFE